MGKRASRRRIIRPPKIEKVKTASQYARVDCDLRIARNQFEALRRSLNMTQDQFAEKLGTIKQSIGHYEAETSFPTPASWNRMKENAAQHGIELSDDILNELLQKKLEKKKAMIERHHEKKLKEITEVLQKKNERLNQKLEDYQQSIQQKLNDLTVNHLIHRYQESS